MSKKQFIYLLISCALFISSIGMAQEGRPLTNTDVVKLIKARLAENTIVLVIQLSPTNFDTSADALIRMKRQGATEKVLDAMLMAKSSRPRAPIGESPTTPSLSRGLIPHRETSVQLEGASIAHRAASIRPETCGEDITTMEECHSRYKAGCTDSENPRYDAYLNFLKNRLPKPTSKPVGLLTSESFQDLDLNTPETLTKYNHADHAKELADLGEGKIHTLIGYLYYAYRTGAESCNCQLAEDDAVDYHIGIGFDPLDSQRLATVREVAEQARNHILTKTDKGKLHPFEQTSIVVEMTPHYRARFHPNWTISRLEDAVGRQVKVVGQLMIDSFHANPKENCGYEEHDPVKCWRKSAWELHPVTQFYVCATDQPCALDSPGWRKLDDQP